MADTLQELLLKISGDSSGGQAALGDLTSALQSPIEAVKKLTEGFGEQLTAAFGTAGGAAVEAAGGFAALAAAAYELASKSADVGENFLDLSYKMGASVPDISNLSATMTIAGGSIDQVSNAMFMFQRQVGQDSPKVAQGLDIIGLSMDDLQKLDPAEQFLAISDAIKNVEDPTQRAAAAMDLFSRMGRDLLPEMMKGLGDIADQSKGVATWTEEEAKQAEDFNRQVRTLKLELDSLVVSIGRDLIPVMSGLIDLFKQAAEKGGAWIDAIVSHMPMIGQVYDAIKQLSGVLKDYAQQQGDDIPKVTGDAKKSLDAYLASVNAGSTIHVPGLKEALVTEEFATKSLNESIAAQKKAYDDAAKAAQEALDAHLKNIEASEKEQAAAEKAIAKGFGGGQNVLQTLGIQMGDIRMAGKQTVPDATTWMPYNVQQYIGKLPDLGDQSAQGFLAGFDKTIESDVPNAIIKAIEGGGNVFDAAGGAIGKKLGQGLEKTLGETFGSSSSFAGSWISTLSDTLGSALPVVGSLLGKGLDALFSIGGPSKEELQGRDIEKQFEDQMGGWQQIQKALLAAGDTADQANAKIKAMWDAEKQGAAATTKAVQDIQDTLNQATQDQQDLTAAAQRYGLTIDELGPAMQKQQLDQQAQQLIKDWTLLEGSGANITAVDQKMASSLQAYLDLAKKTGQEVPVEMRPMIEQMIQQGDLTDANGNKITDMTQLGITFSETMTQGFEKIDTDLQKLIEKIGGDLPTALGKIQPPTIDIHYQYVPDNSLPGSEQAWTGGFVSPRGIVHYLQGGGFAPRGTDTIPAMLSPGEAVLNVAAVRRFGSANIAALNAGGSGAGIQIINNIEGSIWSERDLVDRLMQLIARDVSLKTPYAMR